MGRMKKSLYFAGPDKVNIEEEPLRKPEEGEVLIDSILSSVSSGSEKLIYKDRLEKNTLLDTDIETLRGRFDYPVKYGYSVIGEIISTGKGVDEELIGDKVFCFQPHESKFTHSVEDIIPIPDDISPKDFSFLASMETAVNLVLDGAPLIGENVIVIGQGVIGLLTTSILQNFPLDNLITIEPLESRRKVSRKMGADFVVEDIRSLESTDLNDAGADLLYELSGDLSSLEKAVEFARYNGRIIAGSWYGDQAQELNLGTKFHRNRLKIKSSQVSSIDPDISGRWTKSRRLDQAINMIEDIKPKSLITHEIPFSEAERAYRLIDEHPEKCIQIVLHYDI